MLLAYESNVENALKVAIAKSAASCRCNTEIFAWFPGPPLFGVWVHRGVCNKVRTWGCCGRIGHHADTADCGKTPPHMPSNARQGLDVCIARLPAC